MRSYNSIFNYSQHPTQHVYVFFAVYVGTVRTSFNTLIALGTLNFSSSYFEQLDK